MFVGSVWFVRDVFVSLFIIMTSIGSDEFVWLLFKVGSKVSDVFEVGVTLLLFVPSTMNVKSVGELPLFIIESSGGFNVGLSEADESFVAPTVNDISTGDVGNVFPLISEGTPVSLFVFWLFIWGGGVISLNGVWEMFDCDSDGAVVVVTDSDEDGEIGGAFEGESEFEGSFLLENDDEVWLATSLT